MIWSRLFVFSGLYNQKPLSGERGIRTPGTLTSTYAFQAYLLSHSSISPKGCKSNDFIRVSVGLSKIVCAYLNLLFKVSR